MFVSASLLFVGLYLPRFHGGPMRTLSTAPPKQYKSNWETEFLHLERNPYRGSGVKVAVLDTEAQQVDPAWQSYEVQNFLFTTRLPNENSTSFPLHGDMILTVLKKVAPDVEVYHGVVATNSGIVEKNALLAALEWAIQKQVRIINMSMSFPQQDEDIENLLRKAHNQGIILVAASGNEGVLGVTYPASSPFVLAIGGSDILGNKWSQSNYGPEISFCMPSVYIRTDDLNAYTSYREGTSYSSILMTGLLSRLLEEHPTFRTDDLVEQIRQMTGSQGRTDLCGYGTPAFS